MLFFAVGALAGYGLRISNRGLVGVICRWASDSWSLRLGGWGRKAEWLRLLGWL